jgi:hypothetical protein
LTIYGDDAGSAGTSCLEDGLSSPPGWGRFFIGWERKFLRAGIMEIETGIVATGIAVNITGTVIVILTGLAGASGFASRMKTATSTAGIAKNPPGLKLGGFTLDLPRFGQLDHVHRRRVAKSCARPPSDKEMKLQRQISV